MPCGTRGVQGGGEEDGDVGRALSAGCGHEMG